MVKLLWTVQPLSPQWAVQDAGRSESIRICAGMSQRLGGFMRRMRVSFPRLFVHWEQLYPSCDGSMAKSRMTRECHIRFCERLGGRLLGPTRLFNNPLYREKVYMHKCIPLLLHQKRSYNFCLRLYVNVKGVVYECSLLTLYGFL